MESIARSKTTPAAGRSTTMTEMAFSGGALASVRQTTHRTSAPLRSHPVAEDTHFFRPFMIQLPPSSLTTVRTPSPGNGEAALALPPWSSTLLQERLERSTSLFRRASKQDRQQTEHSPQYRQGDAGIYAVELLGHDGHVNQASIVA